MNVKTLTVCLVGFLMLALGGSPSAVAQKNRPRHTHQTPAQSGAPSSYRSFVPAPDYTPPGRPIYSLGTWGGVEFYSKPGSSSLDPCGNQCGAGN